MRQNRFIDRYEDKFQRFSRNLIVVIISLCAIMILIQLIRWAEQPYGRKCPDCSKCHSVNYHETKKMVNYLEQMKYKEPTKWLK